MKVKYLGVWYDVVKSNLEWGLYYVVMEGRTVCLQEWKLEDKVEGLE